MAKTGQSTRARWWWPPDHPRTWIALGAALLIMTAATLLGLLLSGLDRGGRHGAFDTGALTATDAVEVQAAIIRVNAVSDDMEVRVSVFAHGRYGTDESGVTPVQDLTVETTSLNKAVLTFPAGQRMVVQDVLFDFDTGEIADYPFDRYATSMHFAATVAGRPAPTILQVIDSDPGFVTRAIPSGDTTAPGFDLQLRRTRGTFAMVWMMYVVMWALALSVLTGALVIGRMRAGLPWPALGWMAASLFALAGYRGTAPGSPPIGCLLDYTVFLWAEAIVAFSMVYVVVRGSRVELGPSAAAERS
ncbi:DUF4436 family protein [Catenulispora subtropica]|uniref:DUF4436 domain-containing protein n=1 Tax=Catenulispora subtropica TaxID=450798 RepID=A0ABP5DKW3_9ACTN